MWGPSLPCGSPDGLMAPPPLERLQDAAHPEASTLGGGGDQPSLRVSWTDLGVEWVGGTFWTSSWVSTSHLVSLALQSGKPT